MNADQILLTGSRIVGAVFIAAAAMKVVNPANFHAHVGRLGLLPRKLVRVFIPVSIGFEAAWGVALLLAFAPSFFLPFTAIVLVVLSCMSVWGVKSGKTADCGCYGGFITPSLWQSVGLNSLYLALGVAAWISHPAASNEAWKLATIVLFAISIAGITEYSLRRQLATGKRLIGGKSPLKVGQRWRDRWSGDTRPERNGHLVAYLGPNCPYCKRWVRVLNAIHTAVDLPPVVAVLSGPADAIDAFVAETGVKFPMAIVPERLMKRLASAVPTTVLIDGGQIQEVWVGQMSSSFRSRFMSAFFPTVESVEDSERSVMHAAVAAGQES